MNILKEKKYQTKNNKTNNKNDKILMINKNNKILMINKNNK
jgi:hypothetical protein